MNIYDDILSKVRDRIGGDTFKKLRGGDIRFIFNLYDKLIFNSQLSKEVQLKQAKIKFRASPRRMGVASICGTISTSPLVYYIDVSPTVLYRLDQANISTLIKIVADQMINIILLISDLTQSRYNLHQKLREKYFGSDFVPQRSTSLTSLDLEYPKSYTVPFNLKTGLFSYQENSCYIDSLLSLIFLSDTDFYRRRIVDSKLLTKRSKENLKLLCRSDISKDNIIRTLKSIKFTLEKTYHNLVSKKLNQSTTLIRELLFNLYPDLKNKWGWDTYNAPAIYDLLTEIFPKLKISPIPAWILDNGVKVSKRTRTLTLFQFWDFLRYSEVGEEIIWDEIDTPILVFQNGGLPNPLAKIRSFKENILNNRYRLFGVIMLHGVQIGQDGGLHYTSYFSLKGGQWCHYDDLGPSIKLLKELPKKVFFETDGDKPEMYFYCKAPQQPIKIKKLDRIGRKSVILADDLGCSDETRRKVEKLKPRRKNSSKTWFWVLKPYEAERVYSRLEKIIDN